MAAVTTGDCGTVVVVGGLAMESVVFETLDSDSLRQYSSLLADRPGGSGWYLSLGAVLQSFQPRLWSAVGDDEFGPRLLRACRDLAISFEGKVLPRSPTLRFVSIAQGGVIQKRFVGGALDQPLPSAAECLQASVVLVGFLDQYAFGQMSTRSFRKDAVVGYAPSNSIVQLDLAQWIDSTKRMASVVAFTAEELSFLAASLRRKEVQVIEHLGAELLVIITDGDRRVRSYYLEEEYVVVPSKIRSVDTIGAGDILLSTCACALSSKYEWRNAVALGVEKATARCARANHGSDGVLGFSAV